MNIKSSERRAQYSTIVDNERFDAFNTKRDGGLAVDRVMLHQSEGYRRQIDALRELTKLMSEKGLCE